MQFQVHLQICSNCQSHQWCTRHKQSNYTTLALELQKQIKQADPSIKVQTSQVSTRKIGSFQVSCNGTLIFSKLSLGYFPHVPSVVRRIIEFVDDSKNNRDLKKYKEPRLISPNKTMNMNGTGGFKARDSSPSPTNAIKFSNGSPLPQSKKERANNSSVQENKQEKQHKKQVIVPVKTTNEKPKTQKELVKAPENTKVEHKQQPKQSEKQIEQKQIHEIPTKVHDTHEQKKQIEVKQKKETQKKDTLKSEEKHSHTHNSQPLEHTKSEQSANHVTVQKTQEHNLQQKKVTELEFVLKSESKQQNLDVKQKTQHKSQQKEKVDTQQKKQTENKQQQRYDHNQFSEVPPAHENEQKSPNIVVERQTA